jgi:hypothetical protein
MTWCFSFLLNKKTETPRPIGTMNVPVGLLKSNRLPETMLNAVLPFGKASRLFHVTALRSNLNFLSHPLLLFNQNRKG